MQRFVPTRPGVATQVATLALTLGVAGCAENSLGFAIVGNTILDSTCMVPTGESKQLGRGIYDVGLASLLDDGYLMIPRVKNQLPTSMMMGGMMGSVMPVEMNNVVGVGFDVEIVPDPGQAITNVLPPGTAGLTRFSVPYYFGTLLNSGGAVNVPIEVINANAANQLLMSGAIRPGRSSAQDPYQTLTVRIRARGIHSGTNIYTQWINFPVEVCAYCLAAKAGEPATSGFNTPAGTLFTCPDQPVPKERLKESCTPAQDFVSSCCLRGERDVLCGYAIPNKAAM